MQEVHLGSNFHWFEHGGFHCSIVPHHWSGDCETCKGKLNRQGHTKGAFWFPAMIGGHIKAVIIFMQVMIHIGLF